MEACARLADFLEAPVGRYITGRTWLYFYPRIGLCGFAGWGRPTGQDIAELTEVLKVELDQPPHVSLVDAHRVEALDAGSFAALQAYVGGHHRSLTSVVARLALVRPSGLAGAITAGFFGVQPPPYPVEIFEEPATALAWLGVDVPFSGELERAVDQAMGEPAILGRLRAWLAQHLTEPRIDEAAPALGTSERSLQRKLRGHATTFQNELNAARVREAERMLLETDAQLTRISLDVGCGSLATFSALFRKLTGESPSDWRAARRKIEKDDA